MCYVGQRVRASTSQSLRVINDYRIGFSRACSVDSVNLLPRLVFELLIEFNIALAPIFPGTAVVSSAAFAVSASSSLTVGAR
jgi:hypothetical protein